MSALLKSGRTCAKITSGRSTGKMYRIPTARRLTYTTRSIHKPKTSKRAKPGPGEARPT